jgi:hypothetical protein
MYPTTSPRQPKQRAIYVLLDVLTERLLEETHHEGPCLVPDTLYELNEETDAEECSKKGIGTDRRIVSIE